MSLNSDARLLKALATGQPVTQRSLSQELGMALGLTNLLIKRLVSKGYVKITRLRPRHVRYLLTAEGQRALADQTRVSLENTVSLYTETRDQIRVGLDRVAREAAEDQVPRPPVVFYGLGDVAEIAFVSLQATSLTLVGAVDDYRTGRFFGHAIERPDVLCAPSGILSQARIIVTPVRRVDEIRRRIAELGLAPGRVYFLDSVISEVSSPSHV